jgi:ankyrin repeat protein
MSIPGLNPFVLPAQDPPPVTPQVPPQIVPPRPGSPTLRNRPARQGDVGQEDASSERGLKRGLPAEGEEAGMDIETSTHPEFKRRRVDAGPATPERLQALIDAGDDAGLRALLQQAPELLNAFHPLPILQGMTPLSYAATKGLEAMARCLIDCNASVQVTSRGSNTPLIFACNRGHLNIARMLHERGAVLTVKDSKGANCLHIAAYNGRYAVVEWLLSEKVPIDGMTNDGVTPLMMACRNGHLKVAQMLHERGASLTSKALEAWNCLLYAANDGREEVVRWLLSKNVPVDEPTEYGITPLMMACRNRHLKVAQMLHRKGASLAAKDNDGDMCLHYAVNDGREEVVSWLLDEKVPLDEPNNSGVTPLALACGRGHLKVAQILHGSGASLTFKARDGSNCLHFAVSHGREEMVRWLLSKKAPVDEPNYETVTPLTLACGRGHLKVAQILHGSGASLTHKASGGLNCLHSAAIRGRKEVVSWLLSQGLGIDEPSDAGTTPLMFALKFAQKKGDFAATRLLIERSANLYLQVDNEELIGDAIFRIACDQERYDVLVSLIERDSDFSAYLDTLPSEGSSETVDPMKIRARSAAVHDLNRVFQGMEIQADLALEDQVDQVDQLLDPAWLSPEKKSDRQQFIDYFQTQFFLTDSNASNQSISKTALSSHALFSYTIHDHLKPQQGEFSNLLQALAGKDKPINTSHKRKILWFKLEALKAVRITQPFQNKHLLPATENIICSVLTRQLDALRLAAQEYFFDEQANFSEVFKKLCEKYIRIGGNFDDAGFNKALVKQGIYGVNANWMTTVIKQAWAQARQRPLDLPSMTTVGRGLDLSGTQTIEILNAELKKSLIQLAKAYETEGLELMESKNQDSYPSLSAELKKRLNHPLDASVLPGFADGMAGLEQNDQDIYYEQIFGQWRQLSAALGVALPEPYAKQQ